MTEQTANKTLPTKQSSHRRPLRHQRRGMLTLEWILLVSVIVIGSLGALAVVRNALIVEYVELTDQITNTNVGP